MVKRTRSTGDRKTPAKPSTGSLGEMLDEAGFQALGRRIKIGESGPRNDPPPPKWVGPIVEFLWAALPSPAPHRWDHLHITAFEVACDALVALGQAVHVVGGVEPAISPALPAILPRWDDVAVIVLCVAAQSNLLGYRHFAGARDRPNPAGLLRPNIRAAHGSGPAYLAQEAFLVFESLGLVLGGRWTEAAETILWRDSPDEWGIDFTQDRRFTLARDIALATVPDGIAQKIKATATISEESIQEWLDQVNPRAPTTKTRQDALKSLQFWSLRSLDGLFYRRWRLNDGWLEGDEARRALAIEYDPLSLNMRREFAARYLPDVPFLSK
ncbi:hypothetical protein [Rhizobium ruizarguesonis]|uniref:hypothetical protein n=1 Tax=Rhizobium ruizarguesonis TaxID=2081791 RepID=UPI0010315A4C|nr:hypothetical protein [Rhizobium ruizarguesonis]TBE87855.1 hypothetical protein ELG99_13955 [Rhizobium ruizarguesonis]